VHNHPSTASKPWFSCVLWYSLQDFLCLSKFFCDFMAFLHPGHICGFASSCHLSCLFQFDLSLNVFGHLVHSNSFISVCVDRWRNRVVLEENALLQKGHLYFSKWQFICWDKEDWDLYLLLQSVQTYLHLVDDDGCFLIAIVLQELGIVLELLTSLLNTVLVKSP